jgi:hypothetical protein
VECRGAAGSHIVVRTHHRRGARAARREWPQGVLDARRRLLEKFKSTCGSAWLAHGFAEQMNENGGSKPEGAKPKHELGVGPGLFACLNLKRNRDRSFRSRTPWLAKPSDCRGDGKNEQCDGGRSFQVDSANPACDNCCSTPAFLRNIPLRRNAVPHGRRSRSAMIRT